jgi:class 3 adenylate cyclase
MAASTTRWSWPLLAFAAVCAVVAAWSAEQVVFGRGLVEFQESTVRLASLLSDGRDKSLALGSMVTLGHASPVIRAVARGEQPADSPEINSLLARLVHDLRFSEIFVANKEGGIVAYVTTSDTKTFVAGRNASFRPYFTSAIRGQPNMYAALGTTSLKRGFYIAAPVASETGQSPDGVIVAKIDFEEVDALLATESAPSAILSPEGVVFASNVKEWLFRVMAPNGDLLTIAKDSRAAKAFEQAPPVALNVDARGWLSDGSRSGKMITAPVDWKDASGKWRLVSFTEKKSGLGLSGQLLVGVVIFLLVVSLGGWVQSNRRLAVYAEDLTRALEELKIRSLFIRKTFGRYMSDEVVEKLLESPEGLKLGGQALPATIVISDLRGFSAISESLPAETVVDMLNMYLEEMTRIVFRHAGTINELMGDGILIVFGAPTPRADDADRAVACALEMQLAMSHVNARNKEKALPELEMGIGINTGVVVAGNVGSDIRVKYAVTGSDVNVASRVESFTVGGQILITEATLKAVSDTLTVVEESSVAFKGIKKLVTLYDVSAISGKNNVSLPMAETIRQALKQKLEITFEALTDKFSSGTVQRGRITGLTGKHCTLVCDCEIELRSNLKISFAGQAEGAESLIYAKVMKHLEDNVYDLTLTYVPPETRSFLAQLERVA